MNNKKILEALQKFDLASQRLTEALAEDDANPLVIDDTIQRFEFMFELL